MMKLYSGRRKTDGTTGDERPRRRSVAGTPKSTSASLGGTRRSTRERPSTELVKAPKKAPEKARRSASMVTQAPPPPAPSPPQAQPVELPGSTLFVGRARPASSRGQLQDQHAKAETSLKAKACDVFAYLVEDSTPSTPSSEVARIPGATGSDGCDGHTPPPPSPTDDGSDGSEAAASSCAASQICRNPSQTSHAFSDADTLAGRDSFGASDAPAPRLPRRLTLDPSSAISDGGYGPPLSRNAPFSVHHHAPHPWPQMHLLEGSGSGPGHGPGIGWPMPAHADSHFLSHPFGMLDLEDPAYAHSVMAPRPCVDSDGEAHTVSPPLLFRKFEYLNRRVLLHLQDEITQLEDELLVVDQHLARAREDDRCEKGDPYDREQLRWRYSQLMGRLETQLGKYHHALSFCRALPACGKPSEVDVKLCQESLEELQLHRTASGIRQHVSDLLCVKPSSARSATGLSAVFQTAWIPIPTGIGTTPQLHVASLAALFILPMLLFNFIPSILARLIVVLGTAGGAAALLVSTNAFASVGIIDWIRYAVVYTGVMSVLAIVAR